MNPKRTSQDVEKRWLDVEEVRLIADLRIMHTKVDELHQVVRNLKRRHDEAAIHKYSDQYILAEDIDRVDEIYLWFLGLKQDGQTD
jgi:hypothetical protein